MFTSIALFELRYHLRRLSTYVYFGLMVVVPFLILSVIEGTGSEVLNSPLALANILAGLCAFGVMIVAAICGMAVYRDFEDNTFEVFFTTPMRLRDYLVGRLTGSLAVVFLIFCGAPIGAWLGSIAPWADHVHLAPLRPWLYLQPFLLFPVTTVFFAGALFFSIGALTRNAVAVYLQGVLFVVIYLGVGALLPGNLNDFWPALLDPFGLATMGQATKYWTLAETNTQYVPLSGVVLWNRVLWVGIGVLASVAALRVFPRSIEALGARRTRRTSQGSEDAKTVSVPVPDVTRRFDVRGTAAQLVTLTRLRLRSIVTDLPFAALVVLALGLDLVATWGPPRVSDTPVLPVTYLMTGGVGRLVLIIITAIYAGELVWKDRALRYDQVHDALPTPTWINLASQFAALTAVQLLMLTTFVVVGVIHQAILGYYRFELPVYFSELFVLQMPSLVAYSALALFVQTVLPNKFLAHAAVIGVFLAPGVVIDRVASRFEWTFPSNLYNYASGPTPMYSDMNRYGPDVEEFTWLSTYWMTGAALLAVTAIRFARRGTDRGWRARWSRASTSWPARTTATAAVAALLGFGAYVYYCVRVAVPYVPPSVNESRWARYERELKKYERLPQPRITAVDLTVDLVPGQGTFWATGTYTLVNKTAEPISSIHVLGNSNRPMLWLRDVSFDRPFVEARNDRELAYRIYQLQDPLKPGGSVRLQFRAGRDQPPFDANPLFVENGTFFSTDWFPSIGYQRGLELSAEEARRKQGLPQREDLPPPDDPWSRSRSLFSADADQISFRATISTDPDQIAVAPGYLTKEWMDRGRRYFTYEMGQTTILNFYTFVSARYVVARDRWRDVDIEVFHDPQHPYNIRRMIDAVKAGLEYYTANFGPYQFRQFRVLEFPRYRGFAQSFPNTVPFSEGIGFISRASAEEDLDDAFFVTLHELAHQWWAHQVVGAFAQGSNILSEMLSEYSSLMVTERLRGANQLRLHLRHDLDGYLRGRRGEQRGEQTLARVTRQPYVWYQKGALAMYALRDAIGELRLNAALRGYLEKVRFQEPPYTTVDEFLNALRAATPADQQSLITDLFETITLFDNRAVSATWRELPDHRYAVTLEVTARKLRADDKGRESEIPINDLVDIGVFTGRGKDERPLFFEKRRIAEHTTTIEIVVDERPTRAGIDPYNKLIDRVSDDNVVSVTRGG